MRRSVTERTGDRVGLSCGHRVRYEADGPTPPELDCPACARRSLPDRVAPGRRTPTFTAESVPPALLGDHRTAVWARLEVEAGSVRFVDDGPGGADVVARPGSPVVIVPDRPHRVVPTVDARFAVQFFDPASSPEG